MQENQEFHFQGEKIQIKVIDNKPWFLAADIAKVLGIKNTSQMVTTSRVKDKDKCKVKNRTRGGYNRKMLFVSEPGFYVLLMRTTKAAAEKFKSWLCEDVLPTIRRTGRYNIQANILPADYDLKLIKAKEKMAKAEKKRAKEQELLLETQRGFGRYLYDTAMKFERKGDLKTAEGLRNQLANSGFAHLVNN